MRRRGPTETGHVRAPADAVRPVVVVRRRLERLRGSIRVRRHGWARVRGATITGERRRSRCRRSTRTALRKVTAYMRGNRAVAHVVITGRTMHVQRGQITTRGHGLGWGRCRLNRHVVREHSLARAPTFLILTQVGLGLSSSFLDSAGVMVLVTGQGRPTSECLLAVGVRALVGSLARMDTTMPSQRRRIAKGLAASLTHMGLLTSVYTRVYCQGGALDKLLSAARPVTSMGPDTSVDSL